MSEPGPTDPWAPPTSESDVAGMIRIQQRAFRETNAFPTHSRLTIAHQTALVRELPPVGSPNAIAGRLALFARGDMLSLDLDRVDNDGDWDVGTQLDDEIQEYLRDLCGNDRLQRVMGVVALGGVIPKDSKEADPRSHATALSAELTERRIFLITRQRLVARFALRQSGQVFVVRKRSDFELRALESASVELAHYAEAIARGGYHMGYGLTHNVPMEQLVGMNTRLRRGFVPLVEAAIRERAPHMPPFSMGYHVVMRDMPDAAEDDHEAD